MERKGGTEGKTVCFPFHFGQYFDAKSGTEILFCPPFHLLPFHLKDIKKSPDLLVMNCTDADLLDLLHKLLLESGVI